MRLPSGALIEEEAQLDSAVDPVRLTWLALSVLAIIGVTVISFRLHNSNYVYIASSAAITLTMLMHFHESLMELPRRRGQIWWYICTLLFFVLLLDPMGLPVLFPAMKEVFIIAILLQEFVGIFQCIFIIVGFFLILRILWRLPAFLIRNGWAGFRHGAFVLPLQKALHAKGYTWLTSEMALQLYRGAGRSASRLPPWEEIGVIPGVSGKRRIDALIAIAKILPKPQKRRKSSPTPPDAT